MSHTKERVRFAPSPTGWLHIGSVRAALFNKLYALKTNGTFILRVEDTDRSRDVDPGAKKIQEDLTWLGISVDEGPYFQSQRTEIYQAYLNELIAKKLVYRCFDTPEELENRRQQQIARGLPPKYDRACLRLTEDEIQEKLACGIPFIWRLKLPAKNIHFFEATRGEMTFDLQNFSDFALTRQDGSFTFLFANFVDDVEMRISMVIRGEDHLSNSASQAALYDALNKPLPRFFHLPLVCSTEGKKLSKRDFGFSLGDLQEAGYLPQAICNYVALLGHSLEEEILPLNQLAEQIPFDTHSPKSSVRYDADKLLWINHQWIQKMSLEELVKWTKPFLEKAYGTKLSKNRYEQLVKIIQPNMQTLQDAVLLLAFVYQTPTNIDEQILTKHRYASLKNILALLTQTATEEEFLKTIKANCPKEDKKNLFALIRTALTGSEQGIGIKDLIAMLSIKETKKRIKQLLEKEL